MKTSTTTKWLGYGVPALHCHARHAREGAASAADGSLPLRAPKNSVMERDTDNLVCNRSFTRYYTAKHLPVQWPISAAESRNISVANISPAVSVDLDPRELAPLRLPWTSE